MNKKSFEKFLSDAFVGTTRERQIEYLRKIITWSGERINRLQKNHKFCLKCKRYSPTSKYKTVFEQEVRGVSLYHDAGYGDGDTHGDVLFLIKYSICPICGDKVEISKERMKVLNEYDRFGHRLR